MQPTHEPSPASGAPLPPSSGQVFRAVLRSLKWWPALAGLAFAAFVTFGTSGGADVAPVLAAAALVYLGAAALQKPAASWPLLALTFIVIYAAEAGWADFDPTWALLSLAVPFVAYGLWRGARTPAGGLPLQTLALIAFGAVAAITLYLNQVAGSLLIAAGLLSHSAWDAYHHWTNKVVSRSMAEFCFVLDATVAVVIVTLSLRG